MKDLVEKAKNGDNSAYSELILLTRANLYKTAFSILRNDADSQDAVQETFIKLYLNLHKIKDNDKFALYANRIIKRISYKIYKENKSKVELLDDDFADDGSMDSAISNISFDNIFSSLDKLDNEIFHLRFTNNLKIKDIARELNMTESNVKSRLRRGKLKLKDRHTPATIFVFVLCMLVASGVIAVSIVNILKDWFNLSDVGVNNDGILMAIENLDWYQEVDMDYSDLGDGYKIKLDYLLMDEMNLYMIFDLESEKDLSKYTDVSLTDLKIVDESGNVICDKRDVKAQQYAQRFGCKIIETDKSHMKFLVYMYADSFPVSKTLNINFSSIAFHRKSLINTELCRINCNFRLDINLLEKFINRNYTNYTSTDNMLKKAIISETGFYAIIEAPPHKDVEIRLIDEDNFCHDCYFYPLIDSNKLKYIIVSTFNNTNCNKINLFISSKIYTKSFELNKLN